MERGEAGSGVVWVLTDVNFSSRHVAVMKNGMMIEGRKRKRKVKGKERKVQKQTNVRGSAFLLRSCPFEPSPGGERRGVGSHDTGGSAHKIDLFECKGKDEVESR